jgi:hypothetical protein
MQALAQLAGQTTNQSTVILFLCGHGEPAPDGSYYFLSWEATRLPNGELDPKTVVSSDSLITAIEQIPAKKVLILFNTCFAGLVAGALDAGSLADQTAPPPDEVVDQVLSAGEGRLVITACRKDQKSWYNPSSGHTLFLQHLLDGLRGNQGVGARGGYIGAVSLYEYVYERVTAGIKELNPDVDQTPVITIREGVGPFPVALYRGGEQGPANLGAEGELKAMPTIGEIRNLPPSYDNRGMRVGGGNYQGNTITPGGDFTGGNRTSGDVITTGNISGSQGIAIGSGARSSVTSYQNQSGGVRFGDNAQVSGGTVVGGDLTQAARPPLDEEMRRLLTDLLEQLAQSADNARELPRNMRATVIAEAEAAKSEVDKPDAHRSLATRLHAIMGALKESGTGVAAAAPLYGLIRGIASALGIPLP